jgi:hypothetical protein
MYCSICKRQMKKERDIDEINLCYVCFMIFNNARKKNLKLNQREREL